MTGEFVDAFGGRYYRIGNVHQLPPFFINVVSASDLWLFAASNGALTAGRVDADQSLFPYQAVDRIYDSVGLSGPFTALWVERGRRPVLWNPLAAHGRTAPDFTRSLYKSVEGDRIWFEETQRGHGLRFRHGWATAEPYGLVRQCELTNLADEAVTVRLLDGLRNLQPPGLPRRVQDNYSCLADAYKTAELLPDTTLAVFALSAGIVDRPEPMESLRASAVWTEGLSDPVILLSDVQLAAWLTGATPTSENHRRGIRNSYLVGTTLQLAPGVTQRWMMVADIGLTQSEVAARRVALMNGGFAETVLAEAAATTRRLRGMVGHADGLQCVGHETVSAHHFANVLFNVMRGGTFADGYQIPADDFAAHVRRHNRTTAARHAALLGDLPAALPRGDLLARVAPLNDPTLLRLATEYLPLTFSRRHGDPSRPWNRFRIHVRDAHGRRVLGYEGNWRDIFQNWEALCLSYPQFLGSAVAKFLNASTADGYNPYRVSHAGIDWEAPDPEDPWSAIGYWGDHQVVYLLKLLEWSARFQPEDLPAELRRPCYSYANVPYRIAPYARMRANPRATIQFDAQLHKEIMDRERELGADARLLSDAQGGVLHAHLVEKLLVLVLTRLTNFVPGGGIWMNTQRPEWNDANNALVGYGVSCVTLCYLRRMLQHCRTVLWPALGSEPVVLPAAVAALAHEVLGAFKSHRTLLGRSDISATDARHLLDALATAGTTYREAIYAGRRGSAENLHVTDLLALTDVALQFADHTIRANRRDDGLYHAYNRLEFTESPAGLQVHRLAVMLEGQVAVLSAGLLAPAEVVALLTALRASPLYRADQHSYLLYPDRELPGFLARNLIPPDTVTTCPLLGRLAGDSRTRLITRDTDGNYRFDADLVNEAVLEQRLTQLAADRDWSAAVSADAPRLRALYEQIFHHRGFTGRSGTMFGYEGLGCIYWHMIAKLLLAVQENLVAAESAGAPETSRLVELYYDVRAGLGFNKTPAAYGAFPTDPYSHTPGHAGAQQPGMTGQVKEEILTRSGELGVRVAGGCVTFAPSFLRAEEFMHEAAGFTIVRPMAASPRSRCPPVRSDSLFAARPLSTDLPTGRAASACTNGQGTFARWPDIP